MTIDVTTDSELWDNTESVVVTTNRVVGSTVINVEGALRRVADIQRNSDGSVTLHEHDIVWNIADAELAGSDLQPGDTITDSASDVWNIVAVSRLTWGSRWQALCRRLK